MDVSMETSHTLSSNESNDSLEYSSCGLTTKKAFERLHEEISRELAKFEWNDKRRRLKLHLPTLLFEAFHHGSYFSSFRWTSALILCLFCCLLLITYSTENNPRFAYVPLQAFFVFCVIIMNVALMLWEINLKYRELPDLTRNLLKDLKDYCSTVSWEPRNYPHLHSPLSPCITLQWTRRDNCIVNLPWSLLVRGDVILLRPGQRVPSKCQLIEEGSKSTGPSILHYGDVFSPYLEGVGEGLNTPKARPPLQETPFILLETPYLISLRIFLSEGLNRPVTVFNKQGHSLFAKSLEFVCLPLVAILSLGINTFRLYYNGWPGLWSETLLVLPFCLILPLVPFLMPTAWVALNWMGTASLLANYNHLQEIEETRSENPFEKGEKLKLSEGDISWKDVKRELVKIVSGTPQVPVRTANLTHVLASITNLCCVDKKGILSWPNPTAEKVFFLRHRSHETSSGNIYTSSTSLCNDTEASAGSNAKAAERNSSKESECVLMSLTHDHLTAFGLQFDDLSWKRYLLSLKPLGLNILLNTCNPATQSHYTKFCSHITCEAMHDEDLVPVSQRSLHEPRFENECPVYTRGCLCELPRQMGFRSKAQEPFHLEHQLCSFRHVPLDMACKDRLARSLSITKLKFPFPHMVSVLLRDTHSCKLELMSQGTTDIILDFCTDYWDGCDVSTLTEKDRKKILDFYHRTSLSAYCTAFAYRPTSCTIKENLTNFYMELPIDPSHLYQAARTPTPHISTEALFGDGEHTEYEEVSDVEDSFRMQRKQIFIGMITMQYQAKTDMVRMIEELEESCIRFVHFSKENELRSRVFSEKMGLESGWNCHISLLSDRTRTESGSSSRAGNVSAKTSGLTLFRQSNEDLSSPDLNRIRANRSKNFFRSKSLRRKLTAGIRSALELSRALSHSAPSAINLEVAHVKFDEEVSVCSRSSISEGFSEDGVDQRLITAPWDCPDGGGEFSELNEDFEESELRSREPNECPGQNGPTQDSITSSHIQSSSVEETSSSEQSASLKLFDMSNRARLPKGIENIRPHLENVDNVPLLVSLFTDCTTPTTSAMLAIMQEYTEVVVVMGSTANAENMSLFMRADLCIGVDPSHPQVCMREPVFTRPSSDKVPVPMEVSRKLNSLPCSLSFKKDDRISLVQLILKSRHLMQHFMSCFQFWASCSLSLCFVQLIAITAFLPPVLSSGDVLWIVAIPVPLLSISLAFAPTNPAVMNQATGKNAVVFNKENLKYILLYYVTKFAPSVAVLCLSTFWIFSTFCQQIWTDTCEYVYPRNSSTFTWGDWGTKQAYSLNVVQKMVVFQLVLYFSVISISFVHRMYQLWHKNPLSNKVWTAVFLLVLVLQVLYTVVTVGSAPQPSGAPGMFDIPTGPYLLTFLWPLLLLPVNELIKRREIRVNVRYQKRARLEFGTKLGMNSPF